MQVDGVEAQLRLVLLDEILGLQRGSGVQPLGLTLLFFSQIPNLLVVATASAEPFAPALQGMNIYHLDAFCASGM
eukprot:Skav214933  [mRNA]  locus=scaffold3017:63328:66049:+ [translate_table: standard]